MSEYGKTRKTKRILAAAMSLAMLLTTIPSLILNADEAELNTEDKRIADRSTVDSYETFLNIGENTLYAGRVWTDKSVYLLDGSDGEYRLDIDDDTVTYDVTSDADFLEVFSALGSSVSVVGDRDVPMDVMFVLDMSSSMGYSTGEKIVDNTRLKQAVDALNDAFDYLQKQNDYNRVGLCLYSGDGNYDSAFWDYYIGRPETDAGDGLPVLALGRYSAPDGVEYFSVSGEKNPHSDNPNDIVGPMGQVSMSVNVVRDDKAAGEKDTLIDDEPLIYNSVTGTSHRLKDKLRAIGATNTQMGLYTAMNMMANESDTKVIINGEQVTRRPVVILITDGVPTVSYSGEEWWEPDVDANLSQGSGNTYNYGNYMLAMATASYMKRQVNDNYYNDPNAAGDDSALIYTFGIYMNNGEEQQIADAFLNPKDNFDPPVNSVAQQIKDDWDEYQQSGSVSIWVNDNPQWMYNPEIEPVGYTEQRGRNEIYSGNKTYYDREGNPAVPNAQGICTITYTEYAGGPYYDQAPQPGINGEYVSDYYTFTPPPEGIDDLIYNDGYRNVPGDADLSDIIKTVLKMIPDPITPPIEGHNELNKDSILSYSDPIGDYMELKDVRQLRLFGETYEIRENGDGSYYAVDSAGNSDAVIVNTSYNDIDVSFKLSDIKIWVDEEVSPYSTESDPLSRYILRVDIPAAALPVRTAVITSGFTHLEPDTDGAEALIVNKYDSDLSALPLRLFYTVGMQNEYTKDGSIDLTKINKEYKELHRDNDTGRVYFYSNYYSSSSYIYNGGIISQHGDAYTTFSPAADNGFYIYQDYLPLYTDPDDPEGSRVTDYNGTAGTYYFDYTYYSSDGTGKTEQIRHTGAMFGSGVPGDSEYGEFLVWYDPDTGAVEDFTPDAPGGSWIAATKAGGIRVGDMGYLSGDSRKLDGNNTDTSDTYYLPTVSGSTVTNNVVITNYLGNNGARSSDDVSLLITKRVESDKDGYEEQTFGFTVTIPALAGETVNAVRYRLYSDGSSEYWLRGAETEVDVSDSDGCLVTTDGTVTDKKVADSKVIVSPDGKQGTVVTEDGENVVVYDVTVDENGLADYTYYYKIDLQPSVESFTLANGSAAFSLKHGEGLLFYGLEDVDVTVTETLTEAQFRDDYRFKAVFDESGALLPVQYDNQSYTVEKTLKSTDSVTGFARNEIHWFNKTVKFDKDETKINGESVETTADPDNDKLHHGQELKVGDEITYTINWANDAMETVPNTVPEKKKPAAATVTITDKLDDGVEFMPENNKDGGVYDEASRTVTWTINAQPGESGTVTLTVKVTDEALKKNLVENKAHIAVDNGTETDTKAIYNPVEAPVIKVEKTQSVNGGDKTVQQQTVNGDDKVTYHITVRNDSSAAAKNVIVSDDIPEGLTLVSIDDDGELDGDTIIWNIGDLAAGASYEVSYTVKVPVVEEYTEWRNIAYASCENDPENSDSPETGGPHKGRKRRASNEVVIDEGAPELVIQKAQEVNDSGKTDKKQTVKGGDEVTYYITVTNNGIAAAEKVIITDVIPKGLTLVSVNDDDGEQDGDSVVWHIGDLAPGASREVSYTVKVPEVEGYARWTNIAYASFENDPGNTPEEPDDPSEEPEDSPENPPENPEDPDDPDPNGHHKNRRPIPSNKVVIEEGTPKLDIVKAQSVNDGELTDKKQTVKAGDKVTYYITVTNNGDAAAEDVILTDDIKEGLTLVAGSVTPEGTLLNGGRTILWYFEKIDIGEDNAVTVSFTVTVPKVDEYTEWENVAEVSFENDPDDPDDPTDPDDPHRGRNRKPSNVVEISEGVPELDIVKTQGVNGGAQTRSKLTVKAGDTVKYCITVTNIGLVDATGVVVTDEVPDGLILGSIGNSGKLLEDGKTILWEIGTIAAGASREVTFTVTVPNVNTVTRWKNIAIESFENNPDNPSDNPDDPTETDPDNPDDPDDPHDGRTPKDSNEVEIETAHVPAPGPTFKPTPETTTETSTEPEPEPEETTAEETTTEPPVTETAPPPPPSGDDNFNLDDDGNPRGDMNIPTEDDRFNLDDDGNPRGNMNLPTGVVVGGGVAGLAAGSLIVAALTQAVGKRRCGRKNK